MFKHLFDSMNEVLDEILQQYPHAKGHKRTELDEQLTVLKSMSDSCIEEWLLFEEKLGKLYGGPAAEPVKASGPATAAGEAKKSEKFQKGEGYYKLGMFDKAIREFSELLRNEPDCLLARAFLAMSYLRSGDFGEAYRHFQLLLPLAETSKMKAISYNAMGCIQAQKQNLDKACEYFQKAYMTDPSCVDPIVKLVSWPRLP